MLTMLARMRKLLVSVWIGTNYSRSHSTSCLPIEIEFDQMLNNLLSLLIS
jgi:hypothetical protein